MVSLGNDFGVTPIAAAFQIFLIYIYIYIYDSGVCDILESGSVDVHSVWTTGAVPGGRLRFIDTRLWVVLVLGTT